MQRPQLSVEHLSVEYRTDAATVYAVNDISFSLEKRETLGLVGETGAGKTTTALALLRLLPSPVGQVSGGHMVYEGQDLMELSEIEMRNIRGEKISMIFQDPMTSLNPIMSVGDQIKESLVLHNSENRSKQEIDARVEEVLELVGIPSARKKDYPLQFSGGMKQRVVIAMALACNPDLLIADEPTTALDVTIQAQVLALIEDLKARLGTSIIMITHDLGVVARTCDKVAVMYAGQIVEYGRVEQIFEGETHHPYTEGLFGAIPKIDDNAKRLKPIDGLMPDPSRLPEGCSFSPRCPHCMERCRRERPVDYERGGHRVKCHLFDGWGEKHE